MVFSLDILSSSCTSAVYDYRVTQIGGDITVSCTSEVYQDALTMIDGIRASSSDLSVYFEPAFDLPLIKILNAVADYLHELSPHSPIYLYTSMSDPLYVRKIIYSHIFKKLLSSSRLHKPPIHFCTSVFSEPIPFPALRSYKRIWANHVLMQYCSKYSYLL